jgi:hypothetical protein
MSLIPIVQKLDNGYIGLIGEAMKGCIQGGKSRVASTEKNTRDSIENENGISGACIWLNMSWSYRS